MEYANLCTVWDGLVYCALSLYIVLPVSCMLCGRGKKKKAQKKRKNHILTTCDRKVPECPLPEFAFLTIDL